ncbi:MAG: MOSC domain-containing protein [Rhizonema sp. PD37]|nr:MOSC domain-containing protein [Rhizonema sp. PD37]
MNNISVRELFIHPFKGLTPQKCDYVTLKEGHGIPGDRAFALMYNEGAIYPDSTKVPWMKKQNFVMQNDWSGLAALDCHYETTTGTLTVKRKDVELLVADTVSHSGRDLIATFFTGYLAGIYPNETAKHPHRAPLQLVGSCQTRYPDREAVHISLIGKATIEHLSELAGQQIDVRRFRPNIVLDGVPAWEEFNWVEREMQLGTARIAVTARINRCFNIHVNPDTGEKDMALLSLLNKYFHHTQTGILAKIIISGTVAIGDRLS